MYRAILDSRERLDTWNEDLKAFESSVNTDQQTAASAVPDDLFVSMTFQNILGALTDLKSLIDRLELQKNTDITCHLTNCPKLVSFTEATLHTIKVLEKTRDSFKSKDLRDLRRMLEGLIRAEDIQRLS